MNILILDTHGNLLRWIPGHAIAWCEVTESAIRIQFADNCLLRNESPCFYAVGNSARKLGHALMTQADQVCLNESEFLSERRFREWKQELDATRGEVVKLLPESVATCVA